MKKNATPNTATSVWTNYQKTAWIDDVSDKVLKITGNDHNEDDYWEDYYYPRQKIHTSNSGFAWVYNTSKEVDRVLDWRRCWESGDYDDYLGGDLYGYGDYRIW